MESDESKPRNLTRKEQAFYATLIILATIAFLAFSDHLGCDPTPKSNEINIGV